MLNWNASVPPAWRTLLWLLLVLALRHEFLMAPPVWDSAMGVFPPAIYLVQNHFDVGALIQLEGWAGGGPNVHTFSLLTWVIAVVLKVTGSAEVTYLILHLATFAGMAWAMDKFYQVLRDWQFNQLTAILAPLFVLLMPPVLVQVGRIYTEIPVLVLSIAALHAYTRGGVKNAALLCGCAVFFKLTAMALSAALLIALIVDRERKAREKISAALWLIGAPLVGLVLWFVTISHGTGPTSWGSFGYLIANARFRLSMVPDIYLLLMLGLACSLVLTPQIVTRNFRSKYGESPIPGIGMHQLNAVLVCVVLPLVYSTLILTLIYAGQLGLHRYFIPLIPFALTTVMLMLRRFQVEKVGSALLAVSCVFFILNQQGRYYPYEVERFAVVERSDEAGLFHEAQVQGIEFLRRSSSVAPVGIGREIDYMVSSPLMGYVDREIPNTFPVYREPYVSMSLGEFPARLMLLETNRFHGGKQIRRLLRQARQDPNYAITRESSKHGPFSTTLYDIQRTSNGMAGGD